MMYRAAYCSRHFNMGELGRDLKWVSGDDVRSKRNGSMRMKVSVVKGGSDAEDRQRR